MNELAPKREEVQAQWLTHVAQSKGVEEKEEGGLVTQPDSTKMNGGAGGEGRK